MGKPASVNASDLFAGAGKSQQVFQLKGRIEELEAEIAQLKAGDLGADERAELEAKIQTLIAELSEKQGVKIIAFEQITRNPLQPRLIFTKAEQEAFANILRLEGQLDPVLLIELTEQNRDQLRAYAQQGLFDLNQPLFNINAAYLLFDGERRWRSGRIAELEGLKSVILPARESLDLLELQSKAASTSLHQKALHKLELAQFLVMQINHRHPSVRSLLEDAPELVYPRALNAFMSRMKRARRTAEIAQITTADREVQLRWLSEVENEVERTVLDVLLSHQQNPASIFRHIFPLLKLPDDLKQAAWDEGLDAEKLLALNQLNAKALKRSEDEAKVVRAGVIQEVIASGWSAEDIRRRAKELLVESNPEVAAEHPKVPKELSGLEKADFSKMKAEELQLCQQLLSRRLNEVKRLLKASSELS